MSSGGGLAACGKYPLLFLLLSELRIDTYGSSEGTLSRSHYYSTIAKANEWSYLFIPRERYINISVVYVHSLTILRRKRGRKSLP